jgi:26S proteasome regulatory subunit N7
LCRIGDKEAALTAFRVAGEKTVSLSQRLDISFTLIRLGFFFDDNELTAKSIEKARYQLEEGGDWDRKNRLKVIEKKKKEGVVFDVFVFFRCMRAFI